MSTLLPIVLQGLPLSKFDYLELGVLTGQCFNRIPAKKKVGVDKRPKLKDPRIWVGTTDKYFKQVSKKERFHIILVDACHEFEQVKRDLVGCSKVLAPGGLVFCHDMVPPTIEFTSSNRCWDTYRILGWCLENKIPCWVTTEDYGLVAFTNPARAARVPSDYKLSFNDLHSMLKQSPAVVETKEFIKLTHQKLLGLP